MQEYTNTQEVDLRDYLVIMLRYKWVLVSFLIIGIICGVIVHCRFPKPLPIFEVRQILSLPTIDINQNLVTPVSIKEKIEAHIYDESINEVLELSPPKRFAFRVEVPDSGAFLKIVLTARKDKIPFAIKEHNALYEAIKNEYAPVINLKSQEIENEMSTYLNQIALRDKTINMLSENIEQMDEKTSALIDSLSIARQSTEEVGAGKQSKLSENESLSVLLQFIAMQQTAIFSDTLENKMDLLIVEKNDLSMDTQKVIQLLELKKSFVKNVQQLQIPHAATEPLHIPTRNFILLFSIGGLAVGIVCSFVLEFISRLRLKEGEL